MLAAFNVAMDFVPGVGDVKGFVEAESPMDYVLASIGVLGPAGDGLKAVLKGTKLEARAAELGANTARGLESGSAAASELNVNRVDAALNSTASGSAAGRQASTMEEALSGARVTSTPGTVKGSDICVSGCAISGLSDTEQSLAQRIKAGEDVDGKLTEQLLTSVSGRTGMTVLDGGKYGSNNGFDLVMQDAKGNVTIILDAKQLTDAGSVKLSTNAAGGANQCGLLPVPLTPT